MATAATKAADARSRRELMAATSDQEIDQIPHRSHAEASSKRVYASTRIEGRRMTKVSRKAIW